MKSDKHQGDIAKKAIEKSGRTKIFIASKMKISRNTLHNKLKQPNLSPYFLFRLGKALNYDFSKDFPDLKKHDLYRNVDDKSLVYKNNELLRLQKAYTKLRADYNKLLNFLIEISQGAKIQELKKEVDLLISRIQR